MTMQKGADLRLEIEDPDNPGNYLAVGGFTNNSVRFEGTTIDVSYKIDHNFRMLSNGGQVQMIATGRGKLSGDAAVKRVQQLVIDRSLARWRVHIPGLDSYEGDFSVTEFGIDGSVEGLADYRIRIASAGPLSAVA